MAKLIIHQDKIIDRYAFLSLCPFGALEYAGGSIHAGAGCRMCGLCVRKGPPGAAEIQQDETPRLDKSAWHGIAVYADQTDGEIHPVTCELIGKARELAAVIGQPVYVLLIGSGMDEAAQRLRRYGADKIYVYDDPQLKYFRCEPYAAVFTHFVNTVKPGSILVGATTVGRQLAPRVAARLKTGLTADCTVLEMNENSDLSQIRPAFGGNIMAHIKTPNHRPQMATVRYKVMRAPQRSDPSGEVIRCSCAGLDLSSGVEVLRIARKEQEQFIEASDVLVAAGRGIKKEEDLAMLETLAGLLGGQLACTRPLAERGWMDAKRQIGLSGRTVRPKLIITAGVSGSVQFAAGMNNSDTIFAINSDPNAPIFKIAHYGIVGDLYGIIPELIRKIRAKKEADR